MTTCPSAPVPSSETAGSAPLLRDLLPAADVARLRTLRPAPPAPGLYAALCRRVPWPGSSLALPCNALPGIPAATVQAPFAPLPDLPAGSLQGLRLGYVLFALPWPDAVGLLRACALAAGQLWLADFILAERNLGLPAALLRRLLPGFQPWGPVTPARIWLRRGGLEGWGGKPPLGHTGARGPGAGGRGARAHLYDARLQLLPQRKGVFEAERDIL